jgi:hypothetical protein
MEVVACSEMLIVDLNIFYFLFNSDWLGSATLNVVKKLFFFKTIIKIIFFIFDIKE